MSTTKISTRQIIALALILFGLAPLSWAIVVFDDDTRRALIIALLAVGGLALNGVAARRRAPALRMPLKLVLAGIGLILLGGALATYQWYRGQVLPGAQVASTPEELTALNTRLGNLLWIAGTIAYLMLSVFVLPTQPDESKIRDVGGANYVDFRTFGRKRR